MEKNIENFVSMIMITLLHSSSRMFLCFEYKELNFGGMFYICTCTSTGTQDVVL